MTFFTVPARPNAATPVTHENRRHGLNAYLRGLASDSSVEVIDVDRLTVDAANPRALIASVNADEVHFTPHGYRLGGEGAALTLATATTGSHITAIAASGDETGVTDLAAVRAAHDAGNDAMLGNGLYYFPATSIPTSSHDGRTLYLSEWTAVLGVYASGNEDDASYASVHTGDADGYRVLWDTGDPTAVSSSVGPVIIGNNNYHAYFGGDNSVIRGVRCIDAAWKCAQTRGGGTCTIEHVYVASSRGDGGTGTYQPVGVQCDRTDPTPGARLVIRGIKMGGFPGSQQGGGIKVAGYNSVLIDGVEQVGTLDRWNRPSATFAERLPEVEVRNAEFPGGIQQFPDGTVSGLTLTFEDMVVTSLTLENVLLGGGEGMVAKPARLWNHYYVTNLTMKNVHFIGFTEAAIAANGTMSHTLVNGESSGELLEQDTVGSIYMEDVIFQTFRTAQISTAPTEEPEVWLANASADRLTGKVTMKNVTRIGPNTGGVQWSRNANAATDLAAGVSTDATNAALREAYLESLGVTANWPMDDDPIDDGATIADGKGNTNLTLSNS